MAAVDVSRRVRDGINMRRCARRRVDVSTMLPVIGVRCGVRNLIGVGLSMQVRLLKTGAERLVRLNVSRLLHAIVNVRLALTGIDNPLLWITLLDITLLLNVLTLRIARLQIALPNNRPLLNHRACRVISLGLVRLRSNRVTAMWCDMIDMCLRVLNTIDVHRRVWNRIDVPPVSNVVVVGGGVLNVVPMRRGVRNNPLSAGLGRSQKRHHQPHCH
tara:strand:- start:23802 stop:24449 length:648 start_codon:yes stop_codon:yes gene_type:complete